MKDVVCSAVRAEVMYIGGCDSSRRATFTVLCIMYKVNQRGIENIAYSWLLDRLWVYC